MTHMTIGLKWTMKKMMKIKMEIEMNVYCIQTIVIKLKLFANFSHMGVIVLVKAMKIVLVLRLVGY